MRIDSHMTPSAAQTRGTVYEGGRVIMTHYGIRIANMNIAWRFRPMRFPAR